MRFFRTANFMKLSNLDLIWRGQNVDNRSGLMPTEKQFKRVERLYVFITLVLILESIAT